MAYDLWNAAFHTTAFAAAGAICDREPNYVAQALRKMKAMDEAEHVPDPLHAYDDGLVMVIQEAHRRGYTVSSNYAREHSAYIGMAASLGMLTTRVHNNVYSREWRPTVLGLSLLNESELDD